MMLKEKSAFCFLLVFIITISTISIVLAEEDEYELEIDEDTEIIWECTYVNEALLKQLIAASPDYDEDDFDVEEGDKLKYEIRDIYEYSEYYSITLNYYEGSNVDDEDSYVGYYYLRVAKDPEDVALDWNDGYGSEFSLTILLTDIKDYLDDFYDNIPLVDRDRISVSSSSIKINKTIDGEPYILILEYDDDGILEKLSLYYNQNTLVYEYELDDVINTAALSLMWLIIILIIVIAAIVAIVIVIVIFVNKRSKRPPIQKPIIPTPMPVEPQKDVYHEQTQPIDIEKEIFESEKESAANFCESCGSQKDTDAKFCPYCGSRF